MIVQRCFLALLFVVVLADNGAAQIKNRKYSLRIEIGAVQPTLNDSARQWLLSPHGGVEAQFMLRPHLGLVGSLRYERFHDDSLNASLLESGKGNANRRWSMLTLAIGPKLYLGSRKSLTPFVAGQIAAVLWEVERHPGGEPVVVESSDGGKTDFQAAEMGLSIEAGLEQLFADRLALSLAARFSYLTGIGADFAEWVDNSRSRAVLGIAVGAAIHFGGPRKRLADEAAKRERRSERGSRQVYESESPEPPQQKSASSDAYLNAEWYPAVTAVAIADSDSDGVADEVDRCPSTQKGEPVDSLGCPIDFDHDGVVDSLDLCPATPASLPVDARGCPDRGRIFGRRIYHALFASGSSALRSQSIPAVDSVITLIKMFQDVRLAVLGYTDAVGSDTANLALSQARAEAMRDYLMAAGIEVQRIVAIGRGESNPITSNQTQEGREQNRRIEFEFSW